MPVLQFAAFAARAEPAFWLRLARAKLDEQRLATDLLPASAAVDRRTGSAVLDDASLSAAAGAGGQHQVESLARIPGFVKNVNTVEELRALDKNALLREVASKAADKVSSLRAPVNFFVVLSFADLKKHTFLYYAGLPVLLPGAPFEVVVDAQPDAIDLALVRDAAAKGMDVYLLDPASGEAGTVLDKRLLANKASQLVFVDNRVSDPGAQYYPSVLLRNYLYLLQRWHAGARALTLHCVQQVTGDAYEVRQSMVVDLGAVPSSSDLETIVGWEKNAAGKILPRFVDLSQTMDPAKLSAMANDLNLNLMRWRLFPELDLPKLKAQKVLLLGAGTLGTYVSRNLIAWGIRHITFVDFSKVSHSNPVRQSLYAASSVGARKAPEAARMLRSICADVVTEGHDFAIPMPGHYSPEEHEAVAGAIERVTDLVKSHDVVFLLMDSRESRWLPSVLGAYYDKVVINAALGFDTFVVLRHGMRKDPRKPRLGCYYCHDVVAPTNSITNRTLDQQCTVTRPGLSCVASAIAVELLVSMLHHPEGAHAPPAQQSSPSTTSPQAPLGAVPHQVRGFLANFQNMLLVGEKYERCPACSDFIMREYERGGTAFLVQCIADPNFIEDKAGLTKMQQEMEALEIAAEGSDAGDDW